MRNGTITQSAADTESRELVTKYAGLSEERMEAIGAGNIFNKFRKLRGHQKAEVIITAGAYGGIALGSVLLLTRGLFTRDERQELENKGAAADKQIQR